MNLLLSCPPRRLAIPSRPLRFNRDCAGFTYLGCMVFIAILVLSSSAALRGGAILQQRLDEEALLSVGKEFRSALATYALVTPPNMPAQPASLNDLLRDPRLPGNVRHLRKLYIDPMTGRSQWGEVRTLDGKGILAVYSVSRKTPVKVDGFPELFDAFKNAKSYEEWVFSPVPAYALLQSGARMKERQTFRPPP